MQYPAYFRSGGSIMGSSGDIIFWLAMANPKPDGLVGYGRLMMNLAGAHVKRLRLVRFVLNLV